MESFKNLTQFEAYVINSLKHLSEFETYVVSSLKHSSEFEAYVLKKLEKLDPLIEKFDKLETKLDRVETRLERVEDKLVKVIENQEVHDTKFEAIFYCFDKQGERIDKSVSQANSIEKKVDSMQKDVRALRADDKVQNSRIERLELKLAIG